MSSTSPSSSLSISPTNTRTSSPASSSDYNDDDDSSDIDELDHRSRKLKRLLEKNLNKAQERSNLLEVAKKRAWLLEEQVGKLEKQTKRAKGALSRSRLRRQLVVFGAFMSSLLLLGLGVNHIATNSKE